MEKRELERDKNPLSPLLYSIVIDLLRLMMVQVQLLSLFFYQRKATSCLALQASASSV